MRQQKGFSLVELLIVVAIIAIIVAIAIPNLLTSRQAAQGAAAAGDLRTINSAQLAFTAGTGNGSFAADFNALQANKYLPQNFGNSTTYNRSGYDGELNTATGNATYNVIANPTVGASASVYAYYTDESGTIRYSSANDPDSGATPMGSK